MEATEFTRRVLEWFDVHGRKQLPWKDNPTPYRVWVSEVMLQQTQVTTVIPYYQRFLARFPDNQALADADLDDVLHLWAGLGYYSRARNLHRAAQIVRDEYDGVMPLSSLDMQKLPGIGRSTAGAILSLATGQRHPVLDGNVKRVLARFAAVEGWPGQSSVQTVLWALAEYYTPTERVADYTQAMMDLGAMVCVRRQPQCGICPLAIACAAHAQGREMVLPAPRPRRELPLRKTQMLLLRATDGSVLLEQRPPVGIWGGLWSFPECPQGVDVGIWCRDQLGLQVKVESAWPVLPHSFSHFRLEITPIPAAVIRQAGAVMEGRRFVWYNTDCSGDRGVAAPVKRLLTVLASGS
ncbi:MAG: A/G-specific adenine glycosylase [Candidatus Contendobacter odensis]|uniref:Adenine DNA glycosylase n=1 Tax=Candidatus Contendibacter odensensis TaxID=1400860 RepID=A0A2G6PGJ8_9GAMM|nr:MAG: A/G-specific adenine glycosylase [Candidatus Contendobacter odensis]